MAKTSPQALSVVPAQVEFLAIYNPSLGDHDETLHDQVVYYSSRRDRTKPGKPRAEDGGTAGDHAEQHEDNNEKLRQIGLAQGMVEFAKAFSNGEAVDSVETEMSRIVLHELERGWWIVASIDLTRLPAHNKSGPSSNKTASATDAPTVEYSAREVCPSALLTQHLLRAHSIFLLHHAPSLDELYNRVRRSKFCKSLERFWNTFLSNWDVLLHGNPAVDIFRGIKLAAGGELGIGVGEEEWGSGEREVLEGLVKRTDGLVDLIVSRSGEPAVDGEIRTTAADRKTAYAKSTRHGFSETKSTPVDGVIFSGVKAISRDSLRALVDWTEWIATYGENAYGVHDNPNSTLRKRPKRPPAPTSGDEPHTIMADALNSRDDRPATPRIPPSLIPSPSHVTEQGVAPTAPNERRSKDAVDPSGSERLMKYLTLGYGSAWSINGSTAASSKSDSKSQPKDSKEGGDTTIQSSEKSVGHFLIGLQGDLESNDGMDDEVSGGATSQTDEDEGIRDFGGRILPRTVNVEMSRRDTTEKVMTSDNQRFAFDAMNTLGGATGEDVDGSPSNQRRKLRVLIYVYRPFIFTFLFELRTPALAIPSFYRSLHHQLGPLQRPLLASTSPSGIAERIAAASSTTNSASAARQPIYDLIYDPSTLTIHSTIPNIPDPSSAAAEGLDPDHCPWTRIEALNVHTQILNTYTSTRRQQDELERTCKTSRGWWVVWMRLPSSSQGSTSPGDDRGALGDAEGEQHREAFLIRKASDYAPPKGLGGLRSRDASGSSMTGGWAAGKLAEGIGIDTRKYIDGLLSLNR